MPRIEALGALLLLASLAGCGGVISKSIRQEAVPLSSFAELREAPAAFRGKTVILGGTVIETRNRPGETILVVLEKPLQWGGRPDGGQPTGGRFLARFASYLDPVVFEKGRKVTIAGTVAGTELENVGEAPYTYVVLQGREVHLWEEPEPAPPWPFYDPWYPWWYDPYWGRRPWR